MKPFSGRSRVGEVAVVVHQFPLLFQQPDQPVRFLGQPGNVRLCRLEVAPFQFPHRVLVLVKRCRGVLQGLVHVEDGGVHVVPVLAVFFQVPAGHRACERVRERVVFLLQHGDVVLFQLHQAVVISGGGQVPAFLRLVDITVNHVHRVLDDVQLVFELLAHVVEVCFRQVGKVVLQVLDGVLAVARFLVPFLVVRNLLLQGFVLDVLDG